MSKVGDVEPSRSHQGSRTASNAALETFWNVPIATLWSIFNTSTVGLSSAEAQRRLRSYGANRSQSTAELRLLNEFVRLFLNPLVIMLLAASLVTALLGDLVDAVIITVIIVISLALDFYQSYRSQSAVRHLEKLIVTTATVRRDGKLIEVPFADLVPGDIIALGPGDLVPADCRLTAARLLAVNQAPLTGESMPVDKQVEDSTQLTENPAEAVNTVFLGTSVVSGTGEALVVNTGDRTAFSQIGQLLRRKAPLTEFERGMHAFATLIARTVLLLVLFVLLVNAWLGRNPIESFLFAVALAVGLTPELMPMIVTVTLAEGAMRMSKKRVIVRHLPAIQNFGSIDVLCSDKTGTLTKGEVQLAKLISPFTSDAHWLAELASVNARFVAALSNPLDRAICKLDDVRTVVDRYERLDEVPFDFVRRRVSVLVRRTDGRLLLITKGAPESILPVCRYVNGEGQTAADLTETARATIEQVFHEQSSAGYRSLAVAYRYLDPDVVPTPDSETDLIFVGLVTFEDPPLEGMSETIRNLDRDGIQLKILTGDDPLIARQVCGEVGMNVDRILTGPEIALLSDPALGRVAEDVAVFARLTPVQKNRIIHALKARGHVVGYLGDGINDAPSLHSADVGISVSGAVDVAREVAEIILLEPSLAVLHEGIQEGRKSFGNIMKYVMMGTSSNFGNMFSMAGATLFLPFLPLLPVQILLNNLLYTLSQLTLPTDDVDPELALKPRKWDMRLVRDFMLIFGPLSSVFDYLTFGALLLLYRAGPALFRTGWFVESIATQILVIYVIRTRRAPWRSRPSRGLLVGTLLALTVGVVVPLTPLSGYLGFVAPPLPFYGLVFALVGIYLVLAEVAKRWFFRRHRD